MHNSCRPIISGLKLFIRDSLFLKPTHQNQQRCISAEAPHLSLNSFTERTHTSDQLTLDDIGSHVNLFGWVKYTRFNNKIIALRDSYGVTQCVLRKKELIDKYKSLQLYNESVIQVSGIVTARPHGQQNSKVHNGGIEVVIDRIDILNSANKNLPMLSRSDVKSHETTNQNRLKYRYLDIRGASMQQALRIRSEICRIIRQELYNHKFIECETPTLFSRTPGGANEFVVPTQLPGKFYSLVQSPQQLKQLLMIGGLDRYFQICRCYRDEVGRSDRQPEFTQVDIELSFTNQNLVMQLIEVLLHKLFTEIPIDPEKKSSLLSCFDNELNLPRMSFKQAFLNYGTDKPDTRFDWTIESSGRDGLALHVPHKLCLEKIHGVIETVKAFKNHSSSVSVKVKQGQSDFTVSSDDSSDSAREFLGSVRVSVANELVNEGISVYKRGCGMLWVTDFPLFTEDKLGKLEPNHHPFTAPTSETVQFLVTNPLKVIGQHYDLVINGQEVAGGSIRIHKADLQKQIFADVLQLDADKFDYFLEALSSGCPPHGGIAIGLDRLAAMLIGRETIRDVIAFPKSSTGRDLMTGCPEEIELDVKKLYYIK